MTEKNKQALLIAGILGGMFLIIIVYIFLMYAQPGIAKFTADKEKLETQMRKDKQKLADYKKWLEDDAKRQELQSHFERLSMRLPTDTNPFRVLEVLKDAFEGTGVNFSRVEELDSKRYGPVTYHPFTMSGSARYHEFGQLVNYIECNPERIMRVSSMKLTNNNKRPSIHPMEIGVATFTIQNK